MSSSIHKKLKSKIIIDLKDQLLSSLSTIQERETEERDKEERETDTDTEDSNSQDTDDDNRSNGSEYNQNNSKNKEMEIDKDAAICFSAVMETLTQEILKHCANAVEKEKDNTKNETSNKNIIKTKDIEESFEQEAENQIYLKHIKSALVSNEPLKQLINQIASKDNFYRTISVDCQFNYFSFILSSYLSIIFSTFSSFSSPLNNQNLKRKHIKFNYEFLPEKLDINIANDMYSSSENALIWLYHAASIYSTYLNIVNNDSKFYWFDRSRISLLIIATNMEQRGLITTDNLLKYSNFLSSIKDTDANIIIFTDLLNDSSDKPGKTYLNNLFDNGLTYSKHPFVFKWPFDMKKNPEPLNKLLNSISGFIIDSEIEDNIDCNNSNIYCTLNYNTDIHWHLENRSCESSVWKIWSSALWYFSYNINVAHNRSKFSILNKPIKSLPKNETVYDTVEKLLLGYSQSFINTTTNIYITSSLWNLPSVDIYEKIIFELLCKFHNIYIIENDENSNVYRYFKR